MKKLLATSFALLAMVAPAYADPLSQMVSPVSDPVNFEDPRIQSELRPIYIYHRLDDKFITNGGNIQIAALQARFAVNDRLAIIAVKDGYIWLNPNEVLTDETGFGNVAAGAKYAFYKENNVIGTGGLTYEIPMGNRDVLQGRGDGFFRPFLTAGYAGEMVNVIGSTGFRFRLDESDSQFYDADLHIDFPIGKSFYPGFEVNLIHVLDGGDRLPIADEGADYFSLGASEADGKTIVTGAAVARVKLNDQMTWGIAYQFPMNSGEGTRVFDWRITTDLTYNFG